MPNEPCSPFLFILNQLEAAEEAKLQEALEPIKRPRGRPPKIEEPPLLPGAYRHILSDEDSEFDKQLLRLEPTIDQLDEQPKSIAIANGALAIIAPAAGKYSCICNGKVIGTSKHKDYWEYHHARGDLRASQEHPISLFVRISQAGNVEAISSAQYIKLHGIKGSMLPIDTLTQAELAIITEQLQLLKA